MCFASLAYFAFYAYFPNFAYISHVLQNFQRFHQRLIRYPFQQGSNHWSFNKVVSEWVSCLGRLWHPWKICAFVLTQRIGVLQNPRSFPTPNVSVSCATRPSIVQTRPINITFITGQSLFTSDCISWQIHLGITWYSELFSLYMPLGYMAKNRITKNGFVTLIFKQELWPIFRMLAMLLELESPSFLQKVAGSIVCSTRGISPLWRLFS